jgi:hypothetical protein
MQGLQQPVLYLIVLSCIGCATVPPAAPAPAAPPNSAAVGNNYIVAIAPPPVAKGTIWDFLGVKGLCQEIGMVANCGLNLLGSRFPGLEPGPLLSAIGDPANAKSTNPAVAAAAAAKADEDAAPQKVKALRYLGTLGCGGCYPDVESALLAALDDCTEAVRFEAASVLAETSRNNCRYCDSSKCCSPKVRKKLEKIAIELNDKGCHVEPSARVRRMARVALCNCGCDELECSSDDSHGPMQAPIEGPSSDGNIPPKPSSAMREPKQQHATFQHPVETAIFESQPATSDQGLSGKSPSEDRSIVDRVAASAVQQVPFQRFEPDQSNLRIRWEAATVTVYHFDSKAQARSVIEFVRKKAIGLDSPAPPESDLKFVTARQMGWARPQDIRSKELARILFELPIGQISPVIEVGNQLMVCRVLEKSSAKSVATDSMQNTGRNRDLNVTVEQTSDRP